MDGAHRGSGLGREIVRAAESWLAARGARTVQPMVRDANDAVGFSDRRGDAVQPTAVLGRWLVDPEPGRASAAP